MKYFILCLLFSTNIFSVEVKWELLRSLEADPKTKKPAPNKELSKVLNKEITITGFMMPLDFESKNISEFLLMPFVPSCMHVPPPPPNQLILVKMKKGSKAASTFYPVEVTGKLSLDINPELESSYKIEGNKARELKDQAPAQTTRD